MISSHRHHHRRHHFILKQKIDYKDAYSIKENNEGHSTRLDWGTHGKVPCLILKETRKWQRFVWRDCWRYKRKSKGEMILLWPWHSITSGLCWGWKEVLMKPWRHSKELLRYSWRNWEQHILRQQIPARTLAMSSWHKQTTKRSNKFVAKLWISSSKCCQIIMLKSWICTNW